MLLQSVVVSSAKLNRLELASHSSISAVYRVNIMGLRIPPFGSPDLSISGFANVGLFSEMKTKLLLKF